MTSLKNSGFLPEIALREASSHHHHPPFPQIPSPSLSPRCLWKKSSYGVYFPHGTLCTNSLKINTHVALAYLCVKTYHWDASSAPALPVQPAPAQESRLQQGKGRLSPALTASLLYVAGKKVIEEPSLTLHLQIILKPKPVSIHAGNFSCRFFCSIFTVSFENGRLLIKLALWII